MIVWWIAVPIVGALLAALWPKKALWRLISLAQASVAAWLISAYFQRAPLEVTHDLQTLRFSIPWWGFQTPEGWMSRYQISLFFATDGAALWLATLTTLVGVILSFWGGWKLNQPRFQIPALLLVQGFALWSFFSYDLIAFYVGFEAVLLPMYYLILTLSQPGEETRRAALEFLLYTLLGSIPMLVGILYAGQAISEVHGVPFTTNFLSWLQYPLPTEAQMWVYGSFVLAFWVKLGLFPLHGWVLRLYRVAPLSLVVLSSALLTKLGGLGWLRFMTAFPQGHFFLAPTLAGLAAVSLIGAALGAFVQKSLRNWLAYSTISHLSLVAVGLTSTHPAGVSGAAWYMVNHTAVTAAQLLLVSVILARTGTDEIARMGGLARSMPQLTALWVLVALASVGLPGLCQFPGELLVLIGSFKSYTAQKAVFIAALIGVVLSAAYMLPVLRQVLFGPERQPLPDLERNESVPLWVLSMWIFGAGFVAAPFLGEIQRTTSPLVEAILYQVLGIR